MNTVKHRLLGVLRIIAIGSFLFGTLLYPISDFRPIEFGPSSGYVALENGRLGFCYDHAMRPPWIRTVVTVFEIPLGWLVALSAIACVFLLCMDPRRRAGHWACGYDLQGNVSGVCPECGVNARAYLSAKPLE